VFVPLDAASGRPSMTRMASSLTNSLLGILPCAPLSTTDHYYTPTPGDPVPAKRAQAPTPIAKCDMRKATGCAIVSHPTHLRIITPRTYALRVTWPAPPVLAFTSCAGEA